MCIHQDKNLSAVLPVVSIIMEEVHVAAIFLQAGVIPWPGNEDKRQIAD